MNLSFHDTPQTAEILESSELLRVIEGPGSARTHVLRLDGGRNVLMIVDSLSGESVVVNECKDDELGSVHDQALDALRDAANDDRGDEVANG